MIWMQYIWKYKSWILLGMIILSVTGYIIFLKVDLTLKESALKQKEAQIEIIQRQNTILQQNAIAVKRQDETLKKIQSAVAPLQNMVSRIPAETKEKLNDENITHANDCIVSFANDGVLPEGCESFKAAVSESESTDTPEGRRKPDTELP
jgi:hypothetical protein